MTQNNSSSGVYIFILKHLVRASDAARARATFLCAALRVRRRLRCLCLTWLPVRGQAARSVALSLPRPWRCCPQEPRRPRERAETLSSRCRAYRAREFPPALSRRLYSRLSRCVLLHDARPALLTWPPTTFSPPRSLHHPLPSRGARSGRP